MAMKASAKWRELPRPNKSECPKLFYKFSTDQYSFTLRLTDLVAIWECSLSRLDIISSARTQRSSIDPSESNKQFHTFLGKLEQSLESGANHLFRATDESLQVLYINTCLNLPKPLRPLSWTFKLEPQDAGELAEQLLRPCLHEASVAKQKIESLLRVIKDKDHVLSRLLEKVENSSIDLGLIFPGVTGLKSRKARVTVHDAEKTVPGMAAFSSEKWSSNFENDSPYAGFDEKGMSSLVAGCERCPKHTIKQHTHWLRGLPLQGTKIEEPNLDNTRSGKRSRQAISQSDDSTATDSEFERAPTPLHLKKNSKSSRVSQRPLSKTSDASQDDHSRPAKRTKLGKIGASGSSKVTQSDQVSTSSSKSEPPAKRHSDPLSPKKRPQRRNLSSDSDTETASDLDDAKKQSTTGNQAQQAQIPEHGREKHGLRGFGRPNALPSRQSSPSRSPETLNSRQGWHPSQASYSKSPVPQRGKIGGLRANKQSQQQTSTPSPNSDTDNSSDGQSAGSRGSREQQRRSKHTPNANSDTDSESEKADGHHSKSPTTKLTISPRKLGRLPNHSTSSPRDRTRRVSESTPSKPTKHSIVDNDPTTLETASHSSNSSPESQRARTSQSTRPNSQQHKPGSKLGSISQSAAESDSTPTPAQDPKPENPVQEETADAKANRRREELKQRLNATGPGKKKRKF